MRSVSPPASLGLGRGLGKVSPPPPLRSVGLCAKVIPMSTTNHDKHTAELEALRAGATSAHDAARARLAGRRAFKAGQPRLAPVADYTRPGDGLTLDRDAVRAWYAGWDAANLAAEVPA